MSARVSSHVATRVLPLYEDATRGWPFLSSLIEKSFAKDKVSGPIRGEITRLLQDMVRWKRAAEFALDEKEPNPSHLLAVVRFVSTADVETLQGIPGVKREHVQGWLDRVGKIENPVEKLGVRWSYPDWLVQRVLDQVGEARTPGLLEAFNRAPSQTLRVNTLKTDVDQARSALSGLSLPAEKGAMAPHALVVNPPGDIFSSMPWQEGWVELQDEASQMVCELVATPPGGTFIDACAGAGGKTLGVGARMGGRGNILALDVNKTRLVELRRRVRRAGLLHVQSHLLDPKTEPPIPKGGADRVLVDAPCTGLGALRRNPEARWRLKSEDVARLAEQQRKIVQQALSWVKPGGRLIYATCSFTRDEGEAVIESVMSGRSDLVAVPIKEIIGGDRAKAISDDGGKTLRTWPDRHDADAFFAAVLRVVAK